MNTGVSSVGWIGVGAMGLPICRNLMKGEVQVTAFDVSRERMDLAAEAGARLAESIPELASTVDTVFSMVFDDSALLAVVSAAAPHMRAGALFVDMSTVSPEASAQAAVLLTERRVRYLRAPVSGSVGIAEAGTLTVLVSGDPEDLEDCRPILSHMSSAQNYVGLGEAARIIKLVINMMVINATALIGEAIAFGERAGVPRGTIVDAINGSIVGSRHYQSRAESLKTRKYTTAGPLRLAVKDLDLALAVARESDLELPMTTFVRQYVEELVRDGKADVEVSVLAEYPRARGEHDVGSGAPEAAAVIAADDARYRAMIAGDVARLDGLLSPDLVYTHSDGKSENKSEYLATIIRSRRLRTL